MTDEVQLLPCPNPWCEAADREGDFMPAVRALTFGNWAGQCPSCFLAGPIRRTEAEAIAPWNTRPSNPDAVKLADLAQPLSQPVPARIWLHDLGCGDITWCDDPAPDGEQIDAVEYIRVDALHQPYPAPDVERALEVFNGGLVKVPDDSNARGFITYYCPRDAMRAALAATGEGK